MLKWSNCSWPQIFHMPQRKKCGVLKSGELGYQCSGPPWLIHWPGKVTENCQGETQPTPPLASGKTPIQPKEEFGEETEGHLPNEKILEGGRVQEETCAPRRPHLPSRPSVGGTRATVQGGSWGKGGRRQKGFLGHQRDLRGRRGQQSWVK